MVDDNKKIKTIFIIIGMIFIIWLSLKIAPFIDGGILKVLINLDKIVNEPLKIKWCNNSIKVILVLELIYLLIIVYIYENNKNYRKGEEHGSARWGNKNELKKYEQTPYSNNKILTKNVKMGLNGRLHRRNLNTLIIGGSGAGKTRFYAKPNVMQCNASMIILDPKGEILRDTGYLLEKEGYDVKILDLINMEKSHCYNPFVYIKTDNDIQRLVTNIFKSTTPKGSTTSDPFWDTAAASLLMAFMFYLWYEAPEEEQNFEMVMEMLREAKVVEDMPMIQSPIDILFEKLEDKNPNHIALKYYKDYSSGADKTKESINITLAARLDKFNLESLAKLTITDELELYNFGEKKRALFCIISDNDPSFNFLISVLYTQLFQQLFYIADKKYNGSLPIPVHFVMDEFANIALPDDFEKLLSVMRSRNIFVSIIIQNLSQIKALFEKQWESIVGNCDEFLYLGGNEQSTFKYISELLGKASINTDTHGYSKGRNGNYSTNFQKLGRELLTPDEVARLNDKYSILFIRGERPIKDKKYNIKRHPNVKYTADGKEKMYIHGKTDLSIGDISFIDYDENQTYENIEFKETEYDLLSAEELEKYMKERENIYEKQI